MLVKSGVTLLVIFIIKIAKGQIVVLTRPDVDDPFKDNPKWEEFKLVQTERLGQLKTLVNNVWDLVDGISYPGVKSNFKESFMKFHFRALQNFFLKSQDRIQDGSSFSLINPTTGLHNIARLLNTSNYSPTDKMKDYRSKMAEVDAMAVIIHQVFNNVTEGILQNGTKITDQENLVNFAKNVHEVSMSSNSGAEPGTSKSMTLGDLGSKIDEEMTSLGPESHLMRGLLQILRNIKQSEVDISENMNYFCYGNNEFGIIPELTDILSDAALYLVMTDLKNLVLDIYSLVLPMLSSDSDVKVKDTLPQRNAMWDTMVLRVTRKFNFTYLDGRGWGSSAGPAVFKCDLPPVTSGHRGQWGKNISTGASPDAGHVFAYDPQSGPLTEDGKVGFFDDRLPIFQAVGFDHAFQGYIESELVLSRPNPSCVGTCAEYTHVTKTCDGGSGTRCGMLRSYHCPGDDKSCMKRSACPSFASRCIRAAKSVTMCPSSDPSKLYDWVSLDGKILKQNAVQNTSDCQSGPPVSAFERWEMTNQLILNAPQYCELCLCTCMSPQNPDDQTYFDIQPTVSDTSAGTLISAIRFVKEGNVIRLAVEQSKPLMKGFIDNTTSKWVDPLPFDKNDSNKTVPIGLKGFMKLNIDLIIGDVGTVLTGVRFLRENDSISLEIQTTPISWPENAPNEITLKTGESTWKSVQPYSSPREPVGFLNPGNPTVQSGPSMPDSLFNSYVEFTTTTYEQDLAQTVIPLFDSQPVYNYEGRRWLRGVGIMHKGKPGSGGFITPVVVPARPYTSIRYFPIPP